MTGLKIDYISDLHIDWFRDKKKANGKYPIPTFEHVVNTRHSDFDGESELLVVAGDIADNVEDTIEWLKRAAGVYKDVLYVDGNHDFYAPEPIEWEVDEDGVKYHDYCISHRAENLSANLFGIENIHYLPTSYFEKNGYVFVGVNGWYDFNMIPDLVAPEVFMRRFYYPRTNERGSRDQKMMGFGDKGFKGDNLGLWARHYNESYEFDEDCGTAGIFLEGGDVTELAKKNAEYLEERIEDTLKECRVDGKKVVVVTHTPPHLKSVNLSAEKWGEHPDYGVGNFGSSHMVRLLEKISIDDKDGKYKNVVAWIHGHEHLVRDYKVGNVRVLANARGYPHEGSEGRYVKSVRL